MTKPKAPSASVIGLFLLIGVGMMVGGMAASKPLLEVTKPLEAMGITLDLGKTIASIGVFLILFKPIHMFFIGPLWDAIYNRTSELERTFTEAENLRAEMAQMRSDYEKRLVETEASAREQIQNSVKEAQAVRNQMMQEAAAAREDMVRKAQEEIDQEKNRVLTDLRLHVVNLTLGATERILGENVDDERNRRLVNEFIDKIEVPN